MTAPPNVVQSVRCACYHLRDATFSLDDHGYSCEGLDGLLADGSALVAEWAGRKVPALQQAYPAWFIEAARDWRRRNGRSY